VQRKSTILRLRDFPLRRVGRLAFHAALQVQKLFRHVGSQPDSRIRWDEFKNKLEAFLSFEYVDLRFELPPKPELPLHEILAKVEMLASPFSVFATEGVGHYLTRLSLTHNSFSDRLPSFDTRAGIPPRAQVPLHAGLGLALAEASLAMMDEPASDRTRLLDQFTQLCLQNSQPQYGGVVIESLGLVARTLHPHLIEGIDQCWSRSEEALAYFWHGVGRGIYFAPCNASPYSSAPWRALEMCLREPPHALGRQNAMAGLAWALTITNLGQPEIMGAFLKHHATQLTESDACEAFIDGICSAATIWREVCPEDPRLEAFLRYKPVGAEHIAPELWKRYVKGPLEQVFAFELPLEPARSAEELFRYRTVADSPFLKT
jgi:hypothetical protein